MQRGLQDRDTIILEHVQQRRLPGIVESEEQEFGVLVEKSKAGQNVVNCMTSRVSQSSAILFPATKNNTYTS